MHAPNYKVVTCGTLYFSVFSECYLPFKFLVFTGLEFDFHRIFSFLDPLNPKSDKYLISLYNITS